MSSEYQLSQPELDELESAHRQATDKRFDDRIKTVYLLGKGWTTSRVAEALLIDRETVRNHFKHYRKGGIEALRQNEGGGSRALLNKEQQRALYLDLKDRYRLI